MPPRQPSETAPPFVPNPAAAAAAPPAPGAAPPPGGDPALQPPLAPAAAEAAPPPTMPQTKSVRFVRPFRQYQRNDCCGFPSAYAEQLIQKGVAVDARQAFVNRAMVRK